MSECSAINSIRHWPYHDGFPTVPISRDMTWWMNKSVKGTIIGRGGARNYIETHHRLATPTNISGAATADKENGCRIGSRAGADRAMSKQ